MAWCLIDRNPAPEWVQQAFGAAVQRFQSGKVPTLDEAFGFARKAKGKQVAAAQRRRFLGLQVAYSVYQMHHAGGMKVKDAIREVARANGIGKTLAGDFWAEHAARIERLVREGKVERELEKLQQRVKETAPDPRELGRVARISQKVASR